MSNALNTTNFAYIDNDKIRGTTGTAVVFNASRRGRSAGDGAGDSFPNNIELVIEPADTDMSPAGADTLWTN